MHLETQRPQQLRETEPLARARAMLQADPRFCARAADFEFELIGDVLVVHGRLPTFHLKQLLQNLLATLDGVGRVDNLVHVVSSAGLSSVGK